MSLLDFIPQAARKIKAKNQQAIEEFAQTILNVKILNYNSNLTLQNQPITSWQTLNQQNNNVALQSVSLASNQLSDLELNSKSWYDRIIAKNKRAVEDFVQKINQLNIQNHYTEVQINEQNKQVNFQPSSIKHQQPGDFTQKVISNSQILYELQYHRKANRYQNLETLNKQNIASPLQKSLDLYSFEYQEQNPERLIEPGLQKQKSAKQILQELQQIHRQKTIQKLKQSPLKGSRNKRTRIIKIRPQMIQKLRQKKQIQAVQKINVNIEFLQKLKIKPPKQTPNFKEFKGPSSSTKKLNESIRIKTIKKSGYLKMQDSQQFVPNSLEKKQQLNTPGKLSSAKSSIFLDSPLRLPILDSKKGTMRPKPYSVYNVSQKGSQMYVNLTNRAN